MSSMCHCLQKWGKNGIISFQTDYNDKDLNIFNISDIEEKTFFETIIVDNIK